jgi:hypothetical protein
MIILPDRHIPRAKFLMPQRRLEWDQPSQRPSKKCIRNQTRFRLTARVNDGAIVWRGWFDDREDADAFLYAMATGQLRYERELWRLPTPWWHPDLGEYLEYDFATVAFLTSGASTWQNWPVPIDFSGNNTGECIGAGGSGFTPQASVYASSGGGGGGGYSKIAGMTLTPGATPGPGYYIGAGGGTYFGGSQAGGLTCFGTPDNNYATSVVGAYGGNGGGGGVAVAGGQVADGRGTTKYRGGSGCGITSYGGSGGGGAGGPHGNGGHAGAGSVVTGVPNSGGSGGGGGGGGTDTVNTSASTGTDGGFNWKGTGSGAGSPNSTGGHGSDGGGGGGAGGTWNNTGGSGGSGTDWDATHGSGGGGGGGGSYGTTDGGYGGLPGSYGGGGGGGAYGSTSAGVAGYGAQGIVVVIYSPTIPDFNMPMMGM